MDNIRKNLKPDSAYLPFVNSLAKSFGSFEGQSGATSADLAKVFYAAATDSKPKHRYFRSFGDRAIVHIVRAYPRIYRAASLAVLNRLAKRTK